METGKNRRVPGPGSRGVQSRCHPVFREKLMHTQCWVGGCIVLMQKPLTWPPQFGAFSSYSITQLLEHFKVKLLVNSLTLWYEFKVDEPFYVKEADQHGFHIWFDLPRRFWSRRWCTFPLNSLLLCLQVVPVTPWFISYDDFGQKSESVFSWSFISRQHPNEWLSDPPRASKERILQQLVSCEVLLLKLTSSTKLQSMLPTHQLFDDDQTLSHCEFF